jgi:hypothetical protein
MGRSLSREKVPLISPEKPDSTAVDRYILDFGRILFWLKKACLLMKRPSLIISVNVWF